MRRLDWKMEVGGEEYDYQRQQVAGSYFWRYPWWIGEFESFFLYLDISVRKFVSDAPRHHRQSRSEDSDIRSQPMPYTVNNNGNNDHSTGYHHQQSHSVSGTIASSNLFVSLQTSISLLGSNNNSLHPSQVSPLIFAAT